MTTQQEAIAETHKDLIEQLKHAPFHYKLVKRHHIRQFGKAVIAPEDKLLMFRTRLHDGLYRIRRVLIDEIGVEPLSDTGVVRKVREDEG